MNPRERLKRQLLGERPYCHVMASGLARGACGGGLEMNEILYTRRHAVTAGQKAYMNDARNVALVCHAHHGAVGHSKAFRAWWRAEGARLYGESAMQAYLDAWPGRVRRR